MPIQSMVGALYTRTFDAGAALVKSALAAATLALLAAPVLGQEAAMPPNDEIEQILAERVDRDMASVGISVAVIDNGETRFISHGTVSRTNPAPVNEFTPFEAGSITKIFTSLVLAQLETEGKINLDAPVIDYLPEGTAPPAAGIRAISSFDLATHMAGLTGLPEPVLEHDPDNPYSGYSGDELLSWFGQQTLSRPVGEDFEYSNVGAAVLGQVIEHITGQPYAEVVEQRVLIPLAMESTSFSLSADKPAGMATGHDPAGEVAPYWDFDGFAPAGSLISTASDLSKFIAAASGNSETELRPAFDRMLEDVRQIGDGGSIGLGWFVTPIGSDKVVWHNGRTGGFASFFGFELNGDNGVVVLSNMSTDAGIDDIGLHLLDPTVPLRVQPTPRQAVQIDPAVLTNYVGDYVLAPAVVLSITTEADSLYAQLTGQQRFEIYPESETKFFYRVVDAQISFVTGQDGSMALVLHQNGRDMPGMRLE